MTENDTRTRRNEIYNQSQARDSNKNHPQNLIAFDNPTIEIPLPSNGIIYHADHPLAGKETVEITMMTAKQENILTNRSLAKSGKLLSKLIESCLVDQSIDSRDMLIGDRNTVMVALRASGYGSEYKVSVTCPACSAKSEQEFMLNNLPIRRLEIQPIAVGQNLFEFKLPLSKADIAFRFLTGHDEEELAVTMNRKKKLGAVDSELVTSSLIQSIVSINGITDRRAISLAIPRMPAIDSKAFRNYVQENEPGMKLRGTMECPECDHVEEVSIPLDAGFFWPDAK